MKRITRYIAVDLGDRRTGLAVGDDHTNVASPWKTLEIPIEHEGGQKLINAIQKEVAREYGSSPRLELVVGLPLHLDGRESDRSAKARVFAERLGTHLGRTVHLADERLTSKQADWAMGGSGLTNLQKKRRRDAIAAAALLQAFLQDLSAGGANDADDGRNDPAHPSRDGVGEEGD